MPLLSTVYAATFEDAEEGILFAMKDGPKTVSVLVSRHALEDIDPGARGSETLHWFGDYRAQFEEIASDKYDKGHVEIDGTVCIRGRDLPGRGQ